MTTRTRSRLVTLAVSILLSSGSILAAEPLAVEPFFTALSVADVDVSLKWYYETLGFDLVREIDIDEHDIRVRILRGSGVFLELIENGKARAMSEISPVLEKRYLGHGVFQFGFLVTDLDEAISRLESLSVPLRGAALL